METPRTRRTEGLRRGGRSARVVEDVLRATLHELARVGYGAMRIDDVAALSGVNKTTIYRRWPTKLELVQATIEMHRDEPPLPDTGTLRGDLVRALEDSVMRFASPEKLAVLRMFQTERGNPEVEALGRRIRTEHRKARRVLVERAIARGELPSTTDPALVVEIVLSTVYSRVFTHGDPVDRPFLESVVDLVIAGARNVRS